MCDVVHDCLAHVDPLAVMRAATAQRQQQQQQQQRQQAAGRSGAVARVTKGTRSQGAMMRMQGQGAMMRMQGDTVVREEPMSLRARATARVQQRLSERRRDDPELECELSTQPEGAAGA